MLIVILRINLKNFYLYIHTNNKKINSIIFGAGSAGIKTVDILYNYNIVALIDDDKEKQGRKYGKIPIISRTEASKFINRYNIQNLYLAVPSQNVLSQRKLLEELKELKIQINILPNINQIDSKNISFIDFENINTNELLERKIFDHNNINKKYYNNKNILITGGGGSIGSEICRQLIDSDFKKLIIYDHSELNMYNIKKEIEDYLKNQKISKNIFYIVGSITDKLQIESVFISHKINIIFHAAAYKHVNLVEDNILSASINNIIGTYNLCDYANKLKIEKFIFISSDKAVRPTNVMGATKRIAEKIIYLFSVNSKTTFCFPSLFCN